MTTSTPRYPSDPAAGHMDPPIRPQLRGRRGELVDILGRRIGAGHLPPGTIIDPEGIGAEFRVSRTVVREAFQVLVAKGMLEPRPRVGTKVADPLRWDVLDHDVIVWQLGADRLPDHFSDLFMLGYSIEPLAAHEAAHAANHFEVGAELDVLCDLYQGRFDADDFAGYCAVDVEFHSTVIRASHSLVFQRLAGTITALLMARNRFGLTPETMSAQEVRRHRDLAHAISDGNGRLAALLMRRLIEPNGRVDVSGAVSQATGIASATPTSPVDRISFAVPRGLREHASHVERVERAAQHAGLN